MLIQMKAYIFHFFFFAELPVGYPFLTHVFTSFLFPLYHEKSRRSLLSVYFHFTGAQTIISARLSLIKNAYSSLLKSFKNHKQQQNESNISNGHIGGIDQYIEGHQCSNDQTQGNEQQG